MLKVLIVAAEAAPFVKTGGLGDVIGSLPKALQKRNIDVRVMLPKYQDISEQFRSEMKLVTRFTVSVGWREQYCGIEMLKHNGVTFYFIDNQYYFKRHGYYGYPDDGERFSYFNRAILDSLPHLDFIPDVIHCNDWHTGMVAALLEGNYRQIPSYQAIKTVFTIHNLKYQGVFPKEVLPDLLGLDWSHFRDDGVEFYQQINFMKAGIVYADRVTTVSKTYAQEIQQPYFGEKLDGLLFKEKRKLQGIVNGIDYDFYNPAHDSALACPYDVHSLEKRKQNKKALQQCLGLQIQADAPLIAIVSRLIGQKGLDLVEWAIENKLLGDTSPQLIILGTGETRYENFFRYLAWHYEHKVSANIIFDDDLARKIYAGADIFLMPSLYEPCGIGQLIAMRYGCLPLVRGTGGLLDTVKPFNELTKEGNGFMFSNYDSKEMVQTLDYALDIYRNKKEDWVQMMQNAMNCDFSWQESARHYHELYQSLVKS